MTLDALIAQLTEIRDWAPGNGSLPVSLERAPDFPPVAMVIPFCAEGGPVTDPAVPLIGVQIAPFV